MSPPLSGRYLQDLNPATGEVIAEIPDSDEKDIEVAVRSAQGAFKEWSETPARERSQVLLKIAALIEERKRDLAQAESMDQ